MEIKNNIKKMIAIKSDLKKEKYIYVTFNLQNPNIDFRIVPFYLLIHGSTT